jgi:hypothetical protein
MNLAMQWLALTANVLSQGQGVTKRCRLQLYCFDGKEETKELDKCGFKNCKSALARLRSLKKKMRVYFVFIRRHNEQEEGGGKGKLEKRR